MPVYVLNPLLSEMRQNPLAYDLTPVIMVGKPQSRLVRGKGGRKQRSKQKYLPSSETHATNPKTGAAFCGAGLDRSGKVKAGEIHRVDRPVVTCMRCIKIITMNNIDRSVPGIERVLGTVERQLKPGPVKAGKKDKRELHVMIRGGDQGRYVSGSEAYISSRKPFRVHRERTRATGGPLYRGTEGITDFNKYVGWMGRPTQTIGEKRGRILSERVSAAEERRRAAAAAAYAETGMAERIASMEEYVSPEEQFEIRSAARGRAAAAAKRREQTAARRAREEAARADRAAALAGSGRGFAGEEYMDNPRRRGGRAAQKRGLAKGQSLMQKAAAAYRAGKYPTMQSALRGVARKSNPLSEDGMVVNPIRKRRTEASKNAGNMSYFIDGEPVSWTQHNAYLHAKKDTLKAYAADLAEQGLRPGEVHKIVTDQMRRHEARALTAYRAGKYPTLAAAIYGVARKSNPLSEDDMVVNPIRKRRKGSKSSGRTAAQSDAARAMSLFRSGRADTLADAWSMVKRGR